MTNVIIITVIIFIQMCAYCLYSYLLNIERNYIIVWRKEWNSFIIDAQKSVRNLLTHSTYDENYCWYNYHYSIQFVHNYSG